MTTTQPPTVLIRRERQPMSRRKKVVLGVGTLLAIPAVAWAISFLIGAFTGSTSFSDIQAAAEIMSVTGTKDEVSGADCTGVVLTSPQAFTADVSTRRLVAPGAAPEVAEGQCTITVGLSNIAETDVVARLDDNTAVPTGWNLTAGPVTVPAGGYGELTLQVEATDTATAGDLSGAIVADAELGPAGP